MSETEIIGVSDESNEADKTTEVITPETNTICEIKNYMDEEGRMVMGHFPIDGSEPFYIGSFQIGTNVGPIPMHIDFEPGSTLEECFADFNEKAEQTVQKAREEIAARSRIVTPDQVRRTGGGIII